MHRSDIFLGIYNLQEAGNTIFKKEGDKIHSNMFSRVLYGKKLHFHCSKRIIFIATDPVNTQGLIFPCGKPR